MIIFIGYCRTIVRYNLFLLHCVSLFILTINILCSDLYFLHRYGAFYTYNVHGRFPIVLNVLYCSSSTVLYTEVMAVSVAVVAVSVAVVAVAMTVADSDQTSGIVSSPFLAAWVWTSDTRRRRCSPEI